MLGIPVGRLQSVTWVVAGVLSFVSIFFQAAILGLPLDPTYGLTALVTALAALALGNFTELPVIAASAVALGHLASKGWPGTTRPTRPSGWPSWPAWSSPPSSCASSLARHHRPRGRDDPGAGRQRARPARGGPRPHRGPGRDAAGAPGRLRRRLHAAAVDGPRRAHPRLGARRARHRRLLRRRADGVVGSGQPGPDVLRRRRGGRRGGGAPRLALGPEPRPAAWPAPPPRLVAVVVGLPTLRLDGMFAAVTTLAFALAASGYLLVRAEFSWIPQGQLGVPYLFGVSPHLAGRRVRALPRRPRARAGRHARPAPQPDRPRPARAAHQPAGRVGLRRARRCGPS